MSFSDQNPYTSYVQRGLRDGQFVAGNFFSVSAGPPRLSVVGSSVLGGGSVQLDDIVYPIGIIQNFNLGQNKNFSRIFELGSDRSYFIPGRTVGQVGLSRIHYHGASLLRMVYAYYQDVLRPTTVKWMWPNLGATVMANPHDVIVPPGFENLFLNLASDLFNQPVGLAFFLKDSNLQTLGAFYLEHCVVPTHTWATDAMGTIVQESVGIQYELLVPIKTKVIPLMTGTNEFLRPPPEVMAE